MQGATRNHAINDVHAETLRFCMFIVAAQKRKATRRNLVQQTPRRGLLATVVTHECNLQWRRSLRRRGTFPAQTTLGSKRQPTCKSLAAANAAAEIVECGTVNARNPCQAFRDNLPSEQHATRSQTTRLVQIQVCVSHKPPLFDTEDSVVSPYGMLRLLSCPFELWCVLAHNLPCCCDNGSRYMHDGTG